jgi:t-SNARE complex subunit (syntaxin)
LGVYRNEELEELLRHALQNLTAPDTVNSNSSIAIVPKAATAEIVQVVVVIVVVVVVVVVVVAGFVVTSVAP